jgi:hypothetical protein
MEIRQAFEKRFGEGKVHHVFDYPVQDHRYPIPVARVVTVRGSNWLIDYSPRLDFSDGEKKKTENGTWGFRCRNCWFRNAWHKVKSDKGIFKKLWRG